MNLFNHQTRTAQSVKGDVRSVNTFAKLRMGSTLIWVRHLSLLLSDILALCFAWLASHTLGTPSQSFWSFENPWNSLLLILGVSLSIFTASHLYRAGNRRRRYRSLFKAVSLSSILLLLISYLYHPDEFVSRSQFLLFWFFASFFVCLGRFFIDTVTIILRSNGAIRYPVIIITETDMQDYAVSLVQNEKRYSISSILTPDALDLNRRDETFAKMQELGIVEVFAAWGAMKDRMFLGQHFQALGITLHVIPFQENTLFQSAKLQFLNDRILCATFAPSTISGFDFWIKRLLDITTSGLFLCLASPVYLLIAAAIRIDSEGPIFFGQTRIGLHGKSFKAWKFRSMVQNADALQADLEKMNQNKDGVLFKIKEDPRITRVGKFIRRYSLDELPQFFNVLIGEMSLVGPRPLPLRDVEKFQQRYFIRQDVLPGVTGLWQVSGRSDIDNFDDVLRLDLYYIQNWSIWLDIEILLKTFGAVLKKSGAY